MIQTYEISDCSDISRVRGITELSYLEEGQIRRNRVSRDSKLRNSFIRRIDVVYKINTEKICDYFTFIKKSL